MIPSKPFAAPLHDSTLGALTRGYAWLPDRMRSADGAVYRTRLLGRPAVAVRGPEAVLFFYDEEHVVRKQALPGPVLDTLFGRGAVHTLDGDAHRARKALFMTLLKDDESVAHLCTLVRRRWRDAMEEASRAGEPVVLFDTAAEVLALAVRDWAGIPPPDAEAAGLAHDCVAMVDGFAAPGLRHLRARRARTRQENAMGGLVGAVRESPTDDDSPTALEAVAQHRNLDGELLDTHTAAVELLNIVRPTIAIAWFVTFAAHALHRWPHHRKLLRADPTGKHALACAHEVRRFYPFAPFVGGLAARDLTWRGERIEKGTMLLLDLYGQNHDPDLWAHPYRFEPHRFSRAPRLPDGLVPQGGGDPARGHRCPGEDITVAVLSTLVTELAELEYSVPPQDLTIPLSRVPTLPRSGFVLSLA
ncbi:MULTISPECIES: cytochrome P450 [Streptomyces]|uniref:Fatty-acid peroxygenase n=2 Tax=Streptomyces TaxID=1883 RepID=A0A7W7U9M1_9ACTN|nr:cytochrome P450 [Streptomyces nymphaeiformis]MBB4986772.1 fatty-acid peroxygenase [Streptomyces nymphaeiformis]